MYIETVVSLYVLKHIRIRYDNPIAAARHYFKAPRSDVNSPVCVSGRSWCQTEPLDYNNIERDIRMNGGHRPAKVISMDLHHDLYQYINCFPNFTSIICLSCFPYILEPVFINQIYWIWISKESTEESNYTSLGQVSDFSKCVIKREIINSLTIKHVQLFIKSNHIHSLHRDSI